MSSPTDTGSDHRADIIPMMWTVRGLANYVTLSVNGSSLYCAQDTGIDCAIVFQGDSFFLRT